jgi:transcription-repair coupling factor (superfamily II helicase)
MLAFFHGQYDVLVCTTIIENGVDLSKANTLFVDNAHRFGLSQLYQLRGRIGRSDVPAYAYLLTPPDMVLDGEAERRLATLQEFSELGAGFRVAAVDLELRGAGNLLGAEQSGHMASVGFELYLRMLEEAVSEAKGEPTAQVLRCEMNLGLDLSVPMEYMEDMNQRLAFYRDLSLAQRVEEVDRVASTTLDRFGAAPPAVARILDAVKLRIRAEHLFIHSIAMKGGKLTLGFDPSAPLNTSGLVRFLSGRSGAHLAPSGLLELGVEKKEDPLPLLGALLSAAEPADGVSP